MSNLKKKKKRFHIGIFVMHMCPLAQEKSTWTWVLEQIANGSILFLVNFKFGNILCICIMSNMHICNGASVHFQLNWIIKSQQACENRIHSINLTAIVYSSTQSHITFFMEHLKLTKWRCPITEVWGKKPHLGLLAHIFSLPASSDLRSPSSLSPPCSPWILSQSCLHSVRM